MLESDAVTGVVGSGNGMDSGWQKDMVLLLWCAVLPGRRWLRTNGCKVGQL